MRYRLPTLVTAALLCAPFPALPSSSAATESGEAGLTGDVAAFEEAIGRAAIVFVGEADPVRPRPPRSLISLLQRHGFRVFRATALPEPGRDRRRTEADPAEAHAERILQLGSTLDTSSIEAVTDAAGSELVREPLGLDTSAAAFSSRKLLLAAANNRILHPLRAALDRCETGRETGCRLALYGMACQNDRRRAGSPELSSCELGTAIETELSRRGIASDGYVAIDVVSATSPETRANPSGLRQRYRTLLESAGVDGTGNPAIVDARSTPDGTAADFVVFLPEPALADRRRSERDAVRDDRPREAPAAVVRVEPRRTAGGDRARAGETSTPGPDAAEDQRSDYVKAISGSRERSAGAMLSDEQRQECAARNHDAFSSWQMLDEKLREDCGCEGPLYLFQRSARSSGNQILRSWQCGNHCVVYHAREEEARITPDARCQGSQ